MLDMRAVLATLDNPCKCHNIKFIMKDSISEQHLPLLIFHVIVTLEVHNERHHIET